MKKKQILLSYSLAHYNPNLDVSSHKYWGSSANILSRDLYSILEELGEVTYVDWTNMDSIYGQEFDLVIGIAETFNKLIKNVKAKTKILFAVNMHPKERNKKLLNFISENALSKHKSLCGWDIQNEAEISAGIDIADYILCVGNAAVYNSYVDQGVNKYKVKMFNYGLIDEVKPSVEFQNTKISLLYCCSEIGLRKGFDVVDDIIRSPDLKNCDFNLHVVGLPSNEFYSEKLKKMINDYPDKVINHGWVNSSSIEYDNLLGQMDFLIFPSLEEGQAGSVVDGISRGIIPLISESSGLDFSPIGYIETGLNNSNNYKIVHTALNFNRDEIKNLKLQTKEYYNQFHTSFRSQVKKSLENILQGHLYPSFSIVLPIFNKEKTIEPLLVCLENSIKDYPCIECHIIFDGCVDRSEAVVKKFFQGKEKKYKISYYVTPNIFEVKTNNIGLKNSKSDYCVIIQDDTFLYSETILTEASYIFEKNPEIAILGGLAGVNYYPLGFKDLNGQGQISISDTEVYWRQDAVTDSSLQKKYFEVDACMRGPLIFRKSFLESHGYLDEEYAPLYNDDMDICFRARKFGFRVYSVLMNVENQSLTMAKYSEEKWNYFTKIQKRNTEMFYNRWSPTIEKRYLKIERTPFKSKDFRRSWKYKTLIWKINLNERIDWLRKLPSRVVNKIRRKLYSFFKHKEIS